MLKRYRITADGSSSAAAKIYLANEHGIDAKLIDSDAVGICERLTRAGYEAYLVGGALRDLLTGRVPKDFDIATDARPNQVVSQFRRARIIGRRFKLVHVGAGRRVFEVATFRSAEAGVKNRYGTLDEDAFRRDFTCNALYYQPKSERLVDYVEGVPDIQQRVLHTIVEPRQSFSEDPVRMIRAIKYAQLAGFALDRRYRGLIRDHAAALRTCSAERLTEELVKILSSGAAFAILDLAWQLGVFAVLMPRLAARIDGDLARSPAGERLRELDQQVAAESLGGRRLRTQMFLALLADEALAEVDWKLEERPDKALAAQLKRALEPLVLPQGDALRVAARLVGD